MTHDYKDALDDMDKVIGEKISHYAYWCKYHIIIGAALQLAQEAEVRFQVLRDANNKFANENEQLRKERDELARGLLGIKMSLNSSTGIVTMTGASREAIKLAKKVSENGKN